MGMQQTSRNCRKCAKQVLATREGTNHILHLILSIVTAGFWLPVWLLVSIKIGGWRCTQCGSRA